MMHGQKNIKLHYTIFRLSRSAIIRGMSDAHLYFFFFVSDIQLMMADLDSRNML